MRLAEEATQLSRFWRRRSALSDIEAELRSARPEPSREFVRNLSGRVEAEVGSSGRLRVAVAIGITALSAVAAASLGGVGYAASAARDAVQAVSRVTAQSPTQTVEDSPGNSQYVKPGKGCGDTNHDHQPKPGTGSSDPTKPCPVQAGDSKGVEGNSGSTPFAFTISIAGGYVPLSPLTVVYATQDGTATVAGADYLPAAGVAVTFAPGETAKTVTVNVVGDTVREKTEAFFVNLSNPSANATIVDASGAGTISNDD